jgi:hypothetical protein
MNKNRSVLFMLTTLTILTVLPMFSVFPVSAQTIPTETTPTATYVINTNSTHFWANDNQYLSTNATFTIQSAFDNLPVQGGKIFLRAGVYPVNGIYITNKQTLDDSPYSPAARRPSDCMRSSCSCAVR